MKKSGEDLKYKQIKWLILTIPTITIALWEYIRHEFLLSYISMEIGNYPFSNTSFYRYTLVFTALIFNFRKNARST